MRRDLDMIADTHVAIAVEDREWMDGDVVSESDVAAASIEAGEFVNRTIGADADAAASRLDSSAPMDDRPRTNCIAGVERGELRAPAAQVKAIGPSHSAPRPSFVKRCASTPLTAT